MPLSEVKPCSFEGEFENIIRNAAFSTSWFLVSHGISKQHLCGECPLGLYVLGSRFL